MFMSYSPAARLYDPLTLQAIGLTPVQLDFNESRMIRQVTKESPKVFKIISQGSYGETQKTLVSVVDFSKKKKGRYIYWREY